MCDWLIDWFAVKNIELIRNILAPNTYYPAIVAFSRAPKYSFGRKAKQPLKSLTPGKEREFPCAIIVCVGGY